MTEHASEETAVLATFPTRHDAETAKSSLEDNGIHAFIVADDVHVPLQLTEGVSLIVMKRQVQRAHEVLNDVRLIDDGLTPSQEYLNEFADENNVADEDADFRDEDQRQVSTVDRSQKPKPPERSILASVVATLIIVMLFFIPWRIEPNDELVWAPFYRSPITHMTTFQELGSARVNYENGEIAFGILLLQIVGVVAIGWTSYVVIRAVSEDNPEDTSRVAE